jgi:hypothetical protein
LHLRASAGVETSCNEITLDNWWSRYSLEKHSTYSTTVLDLNKNAVAPGRHGERNTKESYLSSGNRRDSREPLQVKSTHTAAQNAVVRFFVSHSDGIIALNHLVAYNLISLVWGNFILNFEVALSVHFAEVIKQE